MAMAPSLEAVARTPAKLCPVMECNSMFLLVLRRERAEEERGETAVRAVVIVVDAGPGEIAEMTSCVGVAVEVEDEDPA